MTSNGRVMRSAVRCLLLSVCLGAMPAVAADAPAVQELVAKLRSNDSEVRWQAINKLGDLAHKSDEAREALRAAFDHTDGSVRGRAVYDWMRSGVDPSKGVPFLTHSDEDVRFMAAKTLLASGHSIPACVTTLLEIHKRPHDYSLALDIEGLFSSFGSQTADAAIPMLLDAIERGSNDERDAAILCLEKLEPVSAVHVPRIVDLLQHKSEAIPIAAAGMLRNIGPEARGAIGELRELLKSPKWRVSSAAEVALVAIPPDEQQHLPLLVQALGNPNHEIRDQAAWQLTVVGWDAPGVVAALIDGLQDTDGAAEALIHIGPPVVPELVRILPIHDQPHARKQAAWVLGELGPDVAGPEVIRALAHAAQDSKAAVRAAAITALGKLGTKAKESAAVVIAHALDDHDANVHWAAMVALGRVGQPSDAALATLLAMLDDKIPELCFKALAAIEAMGKSAAPATPQLVRALGFKGGVGFGGTSTAFRVPPALAAIGASAIPALIEALDDPNPQVRGLAAEALRLMGPTAAPSVQALMARLNDEGSYYVSCGCVATPTTVSESAIRALGQIGPPARTAVPRLIEILKQKFQAENEQTIFREENLVEALRLIAPTDPVATSALKDLLRASQQTEDESQILRLKLALLKVHPASSDSVQHVRDLLTELEFQNDYTDWGQRDEFEAVADAIVQLGVKGREFHAMLRDFVHFKPLLHPDYRCLAAAALLRIDGNDVQARVYLERAAKNKDYSVRNPALRALGRKTALGAGL